MAYINSQDVKRIRDALKVAFPEFRFGVRKSSGSRSVDVSILSGPTDFSDIYNYQSNCADINHYHTHQYPKHTDFFNAVIAVIKNAPERKWYNNSDARIDYFDIAFYFSLSVGRWDKAYEIRYPRKGIYHVPDSYMDQVQTALAVAELSA